MTKIRSSGHQVIRSSVLDRETVLGPLLVAPALLLLVGLLAYPLGLAVLFSFTDRRLAAETYQFVGLRNFIELAGDDTFQRVLWNTVNYTFVAVVAKLALGMGLALALHRVAFLKNFWRGAVLLPWIVPTSLSALGWKWIFDPERGLINWYAQHLLHAPFGTPDWRGDATLAMLSVQLVNIWRGTPFFAIGLLAGMQAIPEELYEAARLDGARPVTQFWRVTWPLLIPITLVITVFSIIQTFSDFQIVYVMTQGGPMDRTHLVATFAHAIAFSSHRLGYGSAASLFMLPVLAVVVWLQVRYLSRSDER
jgi:multiple sugar transport system permease protein